MKTIKKDSGKKGQSSLMVIKVERKYKKKEYTIGSLSINGQWICDTLEPRCINWTWEEKIPGKTAIPEGTYRICVKRSSKFMRNMPYLEDVPHFDGVMIHTGNFPKHTEGCILVGYNTVRGLVLKSRDAFNKIMERIDYALEVGKDIIIKITD